MLYCENLKAPATCAAVILARLCTTRAAQTATKAETRLHGGLSEASRPIRSFAPTRTYLSRKHWLPLTARSILEISVETSDRSRTALSVPPTALAPLG